MGGRFKIPGGLRSEVDTENDRRQRLYRVSAIVLKRRDMGEADRLLTVLTRDRGKLTLLAKGVRRAASRKAGHIEPFTEVDILIARGRNFHLVTQAETVVAHRRLREDLWLSAWAYYIAELVDAFTQDDDPHELLSDLLAETLERLESADDPALVARYFELHLLGYAGYQPQLFRCLECGELLTPQVNFFSLESGGVFCPAHGVNRPGTAALPLPELKVLRFLQSRPWEQVAGLTLSPVVADHVETLLAQFIAHQLEHNVRSAAFLDRLRQQIAQVGPINRNESDAPARSA
jgi:DNA repair protein RecO (recombination protein O)